MTWHELALLRNRARGAAAITLGCIALLAAGCAAPHRVLTPEERALNARSFDVLWETVRDKHFDPNLGGVDWEGVRAELRPQVAAATTMPAARDLMRAALARLELSHFGLLPREALQTEGGGEADPGIELRIIDGEAVVTAVRPDSPAEAAGIRPGWVLERIDGRSVQSLIESVRSADADGMLREYAIVPRLTGRLQGPLGAPVKLELRDGADRRVRAAPSRSESPGTVTQFGHLPPLRVQVTQRQLEGGIAYFRLNLFFDPATVLPLFEETVRRCIADDAAGLVLDLRGNPGGIGGMAMGMAGWFVSEANQALGTMRMRSGELRFAVFPRAEPYAGPLAILVDGCTASTAEILAGGLRDLGRARVFGTRTAGAALPSAVVKLPNGDGFQYALADYISAGGQRLEGHGVVPDEEIPLTRAALLAGRDLVLDAAVAWIRSGQR